MEENPSQVQSKEGSHHLVASSRKGEPPRKNRHRRCTVEEDTGDPIKCSGKHCQSCTAGLIADCVAVCCCPCAVVSFFALAFFKAPWMMGRRCLGLGKKKEKKRKCVGSEEEDLDGNSRKGRVEGETYSEIITGFGFGEEDEEREFEAERVWLEMNQLGHLGFGRVSFTGIQSQGKGY
ncbi:hypothetical protein LOK49_LG04G03647 [Camellia lanceoleosa]|uniref:Uncharacterized protein n=1 Tax=Camellia lanceoleosa TaxID=1840588 RepID=A0ACC0HV47_9ERIC|nr:hypothetical protein LOK49_LG04G03647 [Camellia lanceoleosa]